jgi:hypothetical protein
LLPLNSASKNSRIGYIQVKENSIERLEPEKRYHCRRMLGYGLSRTSAVDSFEYRNELVGKPCSLMRLEVEVSLQANRMWVGEGAFGDDHLTVTFLMVAFAE